MSVYISVELQRQVRTRFNEHCAYCRTQEALTVTNFEFEHIIPLCAGGKTVLENLCLACPACNRYKAIRQMVVDPLTEQLVSLFHPCLQSWSEHFAWNQDATEIIGLTSVGPRDN